MDSHEWNKVIGGVLGTVLFVLVVHVTSQAVYYSPPPLKPAYAVPSTPAQAGAPAVTTASATVPAPAPALAPSGAPAAAAPAPAAQATAGEAVPDFATALPMADPMKGEMIAERCGACHDWSKGGPNKIGPNLYGVVGRPKASHPGFEYSSAMKDKGGNWTYAELFNFLRQPPVVIPGTKMGFAGLPKPQDRLDVIAFLRMQADEPAPLQ